jgi:hypothetical protein
MTWKDKLEIGLTDDASFRKDNLPEEQVRGPEIPKGKGRSPEIPAARKDAEEHAGPSTLHEHDTNQGEDELEPPPPPRPPK